MATHIRAELMVKLTREMLGVSAQEAEIILDQEFGRPQTEWIQVSPEMGGEWEEVHVRRLDPCGVEIERFEMWLSELKATLDGLVGRVSGVAGVNLGEAPKNKGGSPESYQWDRIWPEIVVLAAKGQVSEVKEAFYRMLEGHLIAKGINSPSAKHMRTKLKWLHERLRDEGLTKLNFLLSRAASC